MLGVRGGGAGCPSGQLPPPPVSSCILLLREAQFLTLREGSGLPSRNAESRGKLEC